jgi:adenylate cyclase
VLALIVNPGLPDEQTFPLAKGSATIGRTKDNEIFCVHKSLSRKHARVEFDGSRIRLTDLQSKNGIFFNGKRVPQCTLVEGDSFRCGDITFLVEGATARTPRYTAAAAAVQTLESPFGAAAVQAKRAGTRVGGAEIAVSDDDSISKNRLIALIRATELPVGDAPIDKQLDEIVMLIVQVLEVDRIVLLTLDDKSLEMKPRALKTFIGAGPQPYSRRVVEWIVDRGAAAIVTDVSREKALPGNMAEDAGVRAAMCAPINPGGGTIGALYADSMSRADFFKPDDLALLRAFANVAAVAIEADSMRRGNMATSRR